MSDAAMLMTAIGGVAQADQSYQAGQANKAIANFNARQSEIQAQQALEAGGAAENRQTVKGSLLQGAQVAGFAGQGVVATAGTAKTVETASQLVSDMDRMLIGINARRQAYGFQVRAADQRFQAHQAEVQGNEAALGALIRTGAVETELNDPNYRGKGTATPNRSLLVSEGGPYSGAPAGSSTFAFT